MRGFYYGPARGGTNRYFRLMKRQRFEIPLGPLTQGSWQRRDMLLVLLHDEGCAACDALSHALSPPPPGPLRDPELSVRLVRGRGREGDALRRAVDVAEGEAVVVVADRFLELFAVLPAHGSLPGATVEEKVAELGGWSDAVARQCGECSRM